MTLQTRTLLMVTSLLVIAVLATTVVLTWSARETTLDQTEADGKLIAQLLSRSAGFAEQVPHDVEDAIGDQMLVEATITAHLISIAEAADISTGEIIDHLKSIVDQSVLDEIWVTDETGHAYLTNMTQFDFTFSPDPGQQPQAYIFWPLLTGEQQSVVQEARQREVSNDVFKYAGVAGIDEPRIVQVGYEAGFLENLNQEVGITQLVDQLISGENVNAIYIVDNAIATLAYSATPGLDITQEITHTERDYLAQTVREGRTTSYREGSVLKVMAPITDAEGNVTGATLVHLSTERVQAALRQQLLLGALVATFVLAAGLAVSLFLARRVTGPVACLTAGAAAVEAGTFAPDSLTDVAQRTDELGKLARVFQNMVREVYAREQRLKQQVHQLKIEIDQTKRLNQVAEITDTDYFQALQKKAKELRDQTKNTVD